MQKTITADGRGFTVRALKWGELKRARELDKTGDADANTEGILRAVFPDLDVDDLSVPAVKELIREIWALTLGTDTQRGNSSSIGAATPPSGVDTVMPAAAGTGTAETIAEIARTAPATCGPRT